MFVLYSSVLLTLSIFVCFFATIAITFLNLYSYAYSCFLYSCCFYFSYLFFPSSGASKNHHQLPAEAEVFVPDAAAALRGRELSSDPWGVGLSLSILVGSYFGDKAPGFWPKAISLMWVLYSSNCGWPWSFWRVFNQYNGTAQGLNTALVMDWFSPTRRVSDVHFRKFH